MNAPLLKKYRPYKEVLVRADRVNIANWRYTDYLNCVYEMDIKDKSAKLYQTGISLYLNWLNGVPPNEATASDFVSYKEWLKNQDFATSTKNIYLFSVASLYRVLSRYGCQNITLGVKSFTTNAMTEYKKESISIDDWRKILKIIDTKTYSGKKHYLIIFMLYCTGVRQMSLRNLKWKDFSFKLKTGFQMKVQLKGSGIREDNVPLNDEVCKLLEDFQYSYQNHYCKPITGVPGEREPINAEWYVFGIKDKPISDSGIRKVTREWMRKAGVWKEGAVTAHSFRHGLLEHIVEKHGITAAQIMACHSSINSTRIYAGRIEKQKAFTEIRGALNEICVDEIEKPAEVISENDAPKEQKNEKSEFTFMDYF